MRAIAVALAAGFALAATPALAHPHILTEYSIVAVIQSGKFVELRMTWTFDELYSDLVRETVDRNKNGKFDAEEVLEVARKSIPSMRPNGFYTHLTIGGKTTQAAEIAKFDAKWEDGKASYHFSIALAEPSAEFTVSIHDIDFYIDFFPAKAAFQIEGGKASCQVGTGAPVKTNGWGTLTPPTITCKVQ